MLLKYFFDKALAHASYLVGCQKTGEALVIDPAREIAPYLDAAKSEGLRIVAAAETHIHADFVSGSRELADGVGATLYLSDAGPADWKYALADEYKSQLLRDGHEFHIGRVKLNVLHTPGHTPESISFLLTDEGSGAHVPMGIFTGDFVFVGSIGRPDLLESAAGVAGSAEVGARQLYQSIARFRELPDHLQVWPAHGAGSACGKGLGSVPSSTVGYEKLLNPALQNRTEQAFVAYILADQPETPPYFAVMKRVNKVGPRLIKELPEVPELSPTSLPAIAAKHLVIDTASSAEFAHGHVPGTINVPASSLVQWAGFFVDYALPVYLIGERATLPQLLRNLRSIGIDQVGGLFDASQVKQASLRTETYRSAAPRDLRESIESGKMQLVDVRAETEYDSAHIPSAQHIFLGKLLRELHTLPKRPPIVVQCLAGGRSAIAASILQRAGFDVVNMHGGLQAWVQAGLPVAHGKPSGDEAKR